MLEARNLVVALLGAGALFATTVQTGCAKGDYPVDDTLTPGDDGGALPAQGDSGTAHDGAPAATGCQTKADCPTGQVCDPDAHTCVACLADTDCSAPTAKCDTSTHTCVVCAGDKDCPAGKICDPNAKACTPGCNTNHACETGKTCCNASCVATNTVASCSGCGLACDTTHSTGATCDGTTCAYTGCGTGFSDCKKTAPDVDGCETPITTVTDCGACGRACAATNVAGTATCNGTACNSTCNAGYGNCSLPAAPAPDDGCESNLNTCVGTPCCGTLCGKHDNGVGGNYVDCNNKLGVSGNAGTYNKTMLTEAVNSWPGSTSTDTGGSCFGNSACGAAANANNNHCVVWCYTGPSAGYVKLTTDGSCGCPTSGDLKWN